MELELGWVPTEHIWLFVGSWEEILSLHQHFLQVGQGHSPFCRKDSVTDPCVILLVSSPEGNKKQLVTPYVAEIKLRVYSVYHWEQTYSKCLKLWIKPQHIQTRKKKEIMKTGAVCIGTDKDLEVVLYGSSLAVRRLRILDCYLLKHEN